MYDEMQKKLREGLRILEEASEEDRDRLSLALIKLHGALADCIRIDLSQRAPHLGLEVQDASRTSWQDLIRYGQQYLEFTESDARMMSDADRQQQHIARGGTYAESRAELVNYAEFVERRCAAGGALQNPIHPVEAARPAASPIPTLSAPPEAPEAGQPWYKSTLLLIAYSAVFILFFCFIGFLSYSETFMDYVRNTFQRPTPQWTPTGTPGTLPSPTLSTLPSPTFAVANTKAACIIVWVEYPEDLGRKTRARVYEELVSDQVKAAGMTPREFYDQVVEHNPVLEQDDYEFKTGQTYLLPQCE